jgi:GT2 family glycosyltransferase
MDLPTLSREEIPGRPDVLILGRWSGRIARAGFEEWVSALAAEGGRVFRADPDRTAPTVVDPGIVFFPLAMEPGEDEGADRARDALSDATVSVEGLADSFQIRHAVSGGDDSHARLLGERLRDRFGWPVADFDAIAGRAQSDEREHSLRNQLAGLFPRVSVVVVTYNNLSFNRVCLESLLTRTDWPNLELFFVDNASSDGTRPWLEEQRRTSPVPLTVIANPENRGFAAAANQGLSAATGDFLCLLNNDTVVTKGWLSSLVAHLQSDARLGLIGPSTNEIANEAKVPVGYQDLSQIDAWARDFTERNGGRRVTMPMLAMFCIALRRTVFGEIGALDERFGIGMFEDDDYCRRMRQAGYAIACARDSFVHHRGRASFSKLGEKRYLAIFRENERRYREKWKEPPAPRGDLRALPEALKRVESPVVFLPTIAWNTPLMQRPHHLARAIARDGHPVVFECGDHSGNGFDGFLEIEANLYLHRGPRGALDALRRPILWSVAYNVPDRRAWPEARLVYDAIDHLGVFPQSRRVLRRLQKDALARAELVFAVSRGLLREIAADRPDAIYLPNGVDAAAFARARGTAPDPSRRPRATYVGALARWFDFALLSAVARANPEWEFVLYGETLDGAWGRSPAAELPNVVFRGARPNTEIPRLLAETDIGIIPFRVSGETAYVSPIKLYEYFAAGKPAVSSPMPEARAFSETWIADSVDEWSAALSAALSASRDAAFVARLRKLGRENDWAIRGREALTHLLYSAR